jgi:hypothetical protein
VSCAAIKKKRKGIESTARREFSHVQFTVEATVRHGCVGDAV